MKNNKNSRRSMALSDKELAKKYDNGKYVDFDKALKTMAKTSSPSAANKNKK